METAESDSLLNSLETKLEIVDSKRLPLASCCIYRVPQKIRKGNEETFNPTCVSIGPFHYDDKRLEPMQEVKFWYFKKFLSRTQEKTLKDYIKAIRDLEDEIRSCYSETIPMKSDEFVSMILTDASFIIEYLIASMHQSEEDSLWGKQRPAGDIHQDLILLENQLPFFVLECLFNLTFPRGFCDRFPFVDIIFYGFMNRVLRNIYYNDMARFKKPTSTPQVEHLCDMVRILYLPRVPPQRKPDLAMRHTYSISQLHEAGIKFQADRDRHAIELQCSKGVLKLPHILISHWAEIMIGNVIAFEQCHLPEIQYVTDYLILLDDLIDTAKDVEILAEKGILENLLGDDNEAVSVVNKLRKTVYQSDINGDYVTLYEELNKCFNDPYHKYKAIFLHEYWSTPWKIASFIAAILLLLLTLIQTICSIISLFM